MEFIEAPPFARFVDTYLSEADFRALLAALLENPEAGDVMPGTGGFRKYRWRDAARSKGKRGGLRVIYYYFPDDQQVWFVAVYGKNDVADLTPGVFCTPHGATWDHNGNAYIVEWLPYGRVTKLKRVTA